MNSLIKDTARPSLVKRIIPPLYKDLLLWTNREYDPTTHQIKSRITPAYNLTLKQGLCANFNGTSSECSLNSAIDLTGNWSIEISFAPAVVNVSQFLFSEVMTVPTRRFYMSIDAAGKLLCQIGTGLAVAISGALTAGVSYTLYMSYSSATGIVTSKLRTRSTGALTDLTHYTVAGLDSTAGTFRIGKSMTGNFFSGCMHEFTIWKLTKTVAQMDSTKTDAELCIPFSGSVLDIAGKYTINSANITYRHSDYASFRSDEYGFAVKTGAIYPKLLDGTGYAGLVGEPDATYQGLIALKGQPEIGTKQYLGTEYDFGDAAAITDAGISWDEWDDTDDNLNTVGTAETDLDTDYYNAITASLMTCTSIAGYAGTSNVSKRLFFKVADRVMKDDGSFLAESGRVREIMVYKRDLTEAEILRVQKYCREVTE